MNSHGILRMTCCLLVIALCAFSSCSQPAVTSSRQDQQLQGAAKEPVSVSCVIVLPVRAVGAQDTLPPDEKTALDAGADYLTSILPEKLRMRGISEVQSSDEVGSVLRGDSAVTRKSVLQEIAQNGQCPYLLQGEMSRYDERRGSSMAAESPAAATFSLNLIDAQQGRIVWSTNFSEKQSSVSENLFSLGKAKSRGFKWITVQDLVAQGLQEQLASFPVADSAGK